MTHASSHPIGLRSLAVGFPSLRRTNDYWRTLYPQVVERAEQHSLAKVWAPPPEGEERILFDTTMDPYREDPFRGAVERRIRSASETALSMELTAAKGALAAAHVDPASVDLTLVASFMGDRLGVGNASFLAAELGLGGPAWNFESACSGSVVGLLQATSLVRSGDYQRVLVVASTSNSRQVTDDDSMGWFVGDGAGAFLVERVEAPFGVLGGRVIPSVETNDMFRIRVKNDGSGGTRFVTEAGPHTAAIARDYAETYLRQAVAAGLAAAGMELEDVDYWVFNTPTAWYAELCGRTLGIEPDRYHSNYDRYANIGAALMPATLYHGLHDQRIRPGDVVGLYSIGSTATSACAIVRMGEVGLGDYPEPPAVPDADAAQRATPTPAMEDIVSSAPKTQPLRSGRASAPELGALALALWGDDPPGEVREALQDPATIDEQRLGRTWTREHRLDVGEGVQLRVTEMFSLASFVATPRRGVVLLPGPICLGSSFEIDVDGYGFQSDLARDGFFTFAIDYCGTGGSSQPEDGHDLDHDRQVEYVRAAIAQLRALRWLPPVDVIGESIGGAIAAELATDETMVRSCVMSAVLYRTGSSAFETAFLDPRFLEMLRGQPDGYMQMSADYYGNIIAGAPPAVARALLANQPGRYAVAPLLQPTTLPWFDPTGARVPALIVQGEHDNVAAHSDADDLAAQYGRTAGGRADVVRIQGARHIPRLDGEAQAARFRAVIRAFLGER